MPPVFSCSRAITIPLTPHDASRQQLDECGVAKPLREVSDVKGHSLRSWRHLLFTEESEALFADSKPVRHCRFEPMRRQQQVVKFIVGVAGIAGKFQANGLAAEKVVAGP